MTIEQQADSVQAVIDTLTERERWVWVMTTQWLGNDPYIECFSTRDKAVADAKDYVASVKVKEITSEGRKFLLEKLDAAGDALWAESPDALSIEIRKIEIR